MAEDRKYKPLVKLTGLYENQSQRSGETYFSGYLGAVKVVVIRDKNAEPGKPGWNLCVQEKDPRPEQGQGNGGYGQSQSHGQSHGQSQSQGYGQNQRPQQNQSPPAQQYHQNQPMPGNGGFVDDIPF